ncbi:MAG: hypothetical protein HQK73_00935 [Desulfamplus sp.]|nr:hypothetical protein [Desulfamplus sp.]
MRSKTIIVIKEKFYLLLICIMLQFPVFIFAETGDIYQVKKISIIPFEIHSQQDLSYIKNGVSQMLSSRLAWKDNTLVATEKEINETLIKINSINRTHSGSGTMGSADASFADYLIKIADNTKSDYIISGSITEFAGAFSVDATVYSISQNSSQSFFTQAETPEKIIPSVEILSAKINKEIFNRETPSLALIDEEKSKSATRANPEKLMPLASLEQSEKKEKPFWKFWGKDKPSETRVEQHQQQEEEGVIEIPIDTEDDEDHEEDKKPFWKFW